MRADPDGKAKAVSPEGAVAQIKSGMKVFVHGAAATPKPFLTALCNRLDLADVQLYHLHVSGDIPFADPSQEGRSFSTSLFLGPALRKPVEEGRADFMPIFLADIPRRFTGPVGLPLFSCQTTRKPPEPGGRAIPSGAEERSEPLPEQKLQNWPQKKKGRAFCGQDPVRRANRIGEGLGDG